jgi:hypothetical protein
VGSGDQLVARESVVYREFARLYRLARTLRPTGVDRWNGELWATHGELWGSVNPTTGAVRLSARQVLPYLTGSTSHSHPGEQAEALATVLHEGTHTGMELKAPPEPNAVYSAHSRGLMEGVAELRAMFDFEAFADRAGYPDLALPRPHYKGAYAATVSLLDQASGLHMSRKNLLSDLVTGPVVLHFDQLAAGVVRNRLWDVVPHHPDHQRAVRAALIKPMLHVVWPDLPEHSTSTGERVGEEIRMGVDAKVDEIWRHYRYGGRGLFDGDGVAVERGAGGSRREQVEAGAAAEVASGLRFLDAQAPAGAAVTWRPRPGQGARRTGSAPTAGHQPARE